MAEAFYVRIRTGSETEARIDLTHRLGFQLKPWIKKFLSLRKMSLNSASVKYDRPYCQMAATVIPVFSHFPPFLTKDRSILLFLITLCIYDNPLYLSQIS